MININDKTKCSGCHACAVICPKNCISMISDNEGFLYPQINASECIDCGLCEKACPITTQRKAGKSENDILSYAAYTKNEELRLSSSSGGLFTEIATYVIDNNGVVFGAAFNTNFSVSHKMTNTVEGLEAFRGSKYVQSTIGDTYRDAKELLESGKTVLFTGTPCQIGGLYGYLNKNYDNLITQDIICHGVPSPVVWQSYLKQRSNEADATTVEKVNFKDKRTGWKTYSLSIKFDNGNEYFKKASEDLMMKSFIGNYCLRPSCYDCQFKNKIRESDITLADFWGGNKVVPHMDDNKGLSLVIINSEKGKIIFDRISNNLVIEQVSFNEAISYNSSMTKSATFPAKRNEFVKELLSNDFDKIAKKYTGSSFIKKVFLKAKRTLKRIIKR